MSLVTRCPACGTLFKVVADQLKISDGWVRCGQCAHVFDAQAQLVSELPLGGQASQPLPHPTAINAPAHTDSGNLVGAEAAPIEALGMASLPSADQQGDASPSQDAPDSRTFKPGLLRDSGDMDSDVGPSTATWVESDFPAPHLAKRIAPSVSQSAEPTTINDSEATLSVAAESSADLLRQSAAAPIPSFVDDARRAARWRSPWVRLLLSLCLLALLGALALQIALREKDGLAAEQPALKPWLDVMCQYMGCRVEPMKRIEWIVVDGSSFNRINKNNAQLEAATQSYRLSVTLKNTGRLAVAQPHLELSLQDGQDQPILRRVLSPADLGAVADILVPRQEFGGGVTVQISTAQLAGGRINGYRVLAFYP